MLLWKDISHWKLRQIGGCWLASVEYSFEGLIETLDKYCPIVLEMLPF